MKRALAERAKQSGHPNGLAPPPVVGDDSGPQQKVPRIERPPIEKTVAPQDSSSSPKQPRSVGAPPSAAPLSIPKEPEATPSSSSLPKSPQPTSSGSSTPRQRSSLKRQRPGSSENEGADDESAFYLKHQNRALASELKALQHSLRQLENERDSRRKQCQDARQAIQDLEATWTKMEVALQLGMPPMPENNTEPTAVSNDSAPSDATASQAAMPMSTGTGESVELIGALLDSLAALANSKTPKQENNGNNRKNDDMEQTASGVSQRAEQLQLWIWTLLQKINSSSSTTISAVLDTAGLQSEVEALQLQCKDYKTRIAELAKSRDEAANSDRRVRRGLYRLQAGRMKLEEVMKAVEDDDKDGMAAMMALESVEDVPVKSSSSPTVKMEEGVDTKLEEEQPVDSAQLVQLKKQLQDLEEVASSRERQIEEISKEREEQAKRINSLLLPKTENDSSSSSITDDDVRRSSLFVETSTRLASTERQLTEQKEQMKHVTEKWARAKGDVELAMKTLEELQTKHRKRWTELTNNIGLDDGDKQMADGSVTNMSEEPGNGDLEGQRLVKQAQQIVELEHKLKQALENVRQAETVRVSLEEAIRMNEGFQAKQEELKAKISTLSAGKTTSRANASEAPPSAPASSSTPSSKDKEKLTRDAKIKKALEKAEKSKDAAKAKAERCEKERDAFEKTSVRLSRQIREKDDMNAKSLSTILHLKELTDRLEQEKELLENKGKSSGQLALAARLATNAKDRVGEEAMKEKKAQEEELARVMEKCEALQKEKEAAVGKLSQSQAEMTSLQKNVESSRVRCEELTEEATKREEEKRRLTESLAVAQRQSAESAKKFANLSKSRGGMTSEFTTEELTTQVSVLKGRLACPVCNHRDKKCILLRCRHMFCKQCVEENVRNRSRKCPACGQRFDNKDVADVWL